MKDWFRWSAAGAKDGELTFVSGNPGGTDRKLTVAQLEYQRDTALPERLVSLAELRGKLSEYAHRGAEQARHSNAMLFYVENGLKALTGRLEALQDKAFFESKVKAEADFKAALAKDPEKAGKYLPAFDAVARRSPTRRRSGGSSSSRSGCGGGELLSVARTLVRGAAERTKPNEERLREYSDAALPQLTQGLFSPAPVYPEFEIFELTHLLTKMREKLGPDDPVREEGARPEVAGRAGRGAGRRAPSWPTWRSARSSGRAGRPRSTRPPRPTPCWPSPCSIDADGRAVRKQYEDTIQPVLVKNQELIAQAHFAVEGTSAYPDATFTPRLSYGSVQGYEENGKQVAPFTTMGGAFERATGREPFALPKSWLDAKGEDRPGDAVQHGHQQRHHRRQLRLAGDERQGARSSA